MAFTLAGREIGPGGPAFIIAELSANHLGRLDVAESIVRAASQAGADAIKLQTYTADSLTLADDSDLFRIRGGTPWDGRTLHELYESAAMPMEWHERLFALAEEVGLVWFSSPTDMGTCDFLEELGVPAYKVASFDITDIPFIEHVASKGKPVILSTGIATFANIEEAVTACRAAGNESIGLLKCTSEYPTRLDEVNLRTIPSLAETFGCVAGLSDHTRSVAVPAAAVALGSAIVEKHLTIDRSLGGPDSSFSLEPDEFAAMVGAVREVEEALGSVTYEMTEARERSRRFRRSLFVSRDIRVGEELTHDNVRSVRPGDGMHPRYLPDVVGRKARADIASGTPLSWELIEQSLAGDVDDRS